MTTQIEATPEMERLRAFGLEVFSTCPQSRDARADEYVDDVVRVSRWSDRAGCRGMLIYTDNALVDPWLLTQHVLQNTERLCPLVAVQPVYMHPYTAAKMVSTLGFLYGRRIYLNMVAGGFRNDLLALADETPHDERYDRLVEYTTIVTRLLAGDGPVTFDGAYYQVKNLNLKPVLDATLFPGVFVSGSSPAGLAAARALGATAVKYPQPPEEEASLRDGVPGSLGMRAGIIARDTEEEAWRVAHELFPASRKGQMTHQLAMKTSDSQWHRQLSALGEASHANDSPYWLGPFEHYKTFCPYLVGSYERVAAELGRYLRLGFWTFILDIPPSEEELLHAGIAFRQAVDSVV
jgi:alkanesulfonate monooxygenase